MSEQQNTQDSFEDSTETSYEEQGSADPQIEKEAKIFGWVPKEQFRGNEEDWVDADTFVKRGKEINPILRKNNEILMKKLEELEQRFQQREITIQQFSKYHAETEKRAYEKAISDLKAEKKDALNMGDTDRVVEIDDAIDELKNSQRNIVAPTIPTQQEIPPPDPAFISWVNENSWYSQDKRLNKFANAIGQEVREENPYLFGVNFLEEVKRRVVEEFPHKFEKQSKHNPVESTTGGVRKTGKKTARDLPAEDRKVMEQFVKEGLLTEEQYLKEYFA